MKAFLFFSLLSFACFAEEVAGVAAPSILVIVLGCLFAVSEVLASIPSLNANSIFQLAKTVAKALLDSIKGK